MKGLTDIPGLRVGHASDFEALTGCTAIICDRGAVAGADIRGFATGTQEFDVMDPMHITPRIHAVVFAGGSAFGLEAASGVRKHLAQRGVGFMTGHGPIPIVPSAILYDLSLGKSGVRPTREMGEAAAAAAHDGAVTEGCVGAGTGATVGKINGFLCAMKAGLGSYTVSLSGPYACVRVSALAVVNSLGDVIDSATGKVIAGARTAPNSREFARGARLLKQGIRAGFQPGNTTLGNTTLVVVATNAKLSKVQAKKVAQLAHHGMVRSILPVHTDSDGDVTIALSCGNEECHTEALGIAAAEAVSGAIERAVRLATGMGGLPGLRDAR